MIVREGKHWNWRFHDIDLQIIVEIERKKYQLWCQRQAYENTISKGIDKQQPLAVMWLHRELLTVQRWMQEIREAPQRPSTVCCPRCGKTFTQERERMFGTMTVSEDKALLAIQLLIEGTSIRSAERI